MAYDQYIANAEQGGANDSCQFWQDLKVQEIRNIDRLKFLIRTRVQDGSL